MLQQPHLMPDTTAIDTDTDASRTHRTVTAAALAGSAVLIGIGGLIAPPNDGQASGLYDAATSAPGRLTAEAAILVTGVEDPDARAHGANESLHLGEFEKVCLAEALLLARLGALPH